MPLKFYSRIFGDFVERVLITSNEKELSHRSGSEAALSVQNTLTKINIDAQRQRAVGCSDWLDGSWLSRIVFLNHLQRIERENVSNLPAINGAPAGACLISV